MRNILFNRHSSKLGLLGSLVAVVVFSLVLVAFPSATAKINAENCVNPPTTPTLNNWPVTYSDSNTPLCHDFPAIDAGVYNEGSRTVYSQSEADWNNGLTLSTGQRGVALMYIHNGAANNLPQSQTTAKNVKVTSTISNTAGTSHTISVKFQGDNTNTVNKSFTIHTPANSKLEVESNSGAIYDYQGQLLPGKSGLNLGNSTYTIGDLNACFEYSLFLSFRFKVVTETPTDDDANLSINKQVRSLDDNSSFSNSVTVDEGERVQYRVVVRNTGDETAKNVTMRDNGTSGVDLDSNSVVIYDEDDDEIDDSDWSGSLPGTLRLGDLRPNEERTIIYNGRADTDRGTHVNTAVADSDNTDSVQDDASVIIRRENDDDNDREIKISKLVKNTSEGTSYRESVDVEEGDRVHFKITVTNTGDTTVNNVKVTDRLPSGLRFDDSVSTDGRSSFSGSTLTVNLGSMSRGESETIEFAARVTEDDKGEVCNVARATGDNVDSVEDKACVDIDIPNKPGTPNITLHKKAYNNNKNADATTVNADRGNTITFTLTTTNNGSATKHDYVITDDLSGVLPLADIVDLNGGKLNGNTLTFPAVDIKAGETVTKTFKVSVKTTLAPSISYQIKNTYGNTVVITIPGQVIYEAPKTGSAATSAAVFAGLVTAGAVVVRRGKDILGFIFA